MRRVGWRLSLVFSVASGIGISWGVGGVPSPVLNMRRSLAIIVNAERGGRRLGTDVEYFSNG
ncbi:hypothetical protein BU24DRAFT_425153 [Aaosphaeria arxii CBS 175.79]|uniref:Uncharacterized protein n=1 Tax=Aaosphaeria arxii CBS 175.79 TaxID=1450172 RepID=A0A6A5XI28_9PLEO|nr:uncharacterized protein BU24DRAFT_425153 [Aaosphaeria arxii CBS 175.79]KAF2012507.1 hypothetical protein BU24DRAFT_425153 [Aaosphaeria arxii CBS 175.79]